ncbi:MAG: 8-amino-7-oxononanoate synthase [Pirellulaceae bacterium]|nr:8-amino-7-oxononanoate synthase [Pirellulaceae bacterium]
MNPLDWIADELRQLDAQHLRRHPTVRRGPQANQIELDGRSYLNFGSNDYLGLAADPLIRTAVTETVQAQGWGSGGSALITGRSLQQQQLEQQLAQFECTEAALVFPTGYAANLGTLTSLAGRGDLIFSDALNHASLIDGCRLSRGEVRVYPHADIDYLRSELKGVNAERRTLIVTDSLFSMDGDFAPLAQLIELCDEFHAILVVDEAHATGVLGKQGRGVCELLGVEDSVPVRIGTFSKAIGSLGGFVVGSKNLIEWLFNRARTQVFSTALPASACQASATALQIVQNEPQRRARLQRHAHELRSHLLAEGWDISDSESHIIPIVIGSSEQTLSAARQLRDGGLLVPAIRPPTVPINASRLRISLTSDHTTENLQTLTKALAPVKSALRD